MGGPPPKDPRLRQRRNKSTTAGKIEAKARKAPSLPKRRGGWHARTIAWWKKVWTGDLQGRFLDVDFYPLLRLAELWDDYYAASSPAGRLEIAKELRLQESRWPFDEMARRSLQIEIERPADTEKKAESAPAEEAVDPRTVLRMVK